MAQLPIRPHLLHSRNKICPSPSRSTCTGLQSPDTKKASYPRSEVQSRISWASASAMQPKTRVPIRPPILRCTRSNLASRPPRLCPTVNGSKPGALLGLPAGLPSSISSLPTSWARTVCLGPWLRWATDRAFLCTRSSVPWLDTPAGRYALQKVPSHLSVR